MAPSLYQSRERYPRRPTASQCPIWPRARGHSAGPSRRRAWDQHVGCKAHPWRSLDRNPRKVLHRFEHSSIELELLEVRVLPDRIDDLANRGSHIGGGLKVHVVAAVYEYLFVIVREQRKPRLAFLALLFHLRGGHVHIVSIPTVRSSEHEYGNAAQCSRLGRFQPLGKYSADHSRWLISALYTAGNCCAQR
jgi:hypothetical protein